MKPAALALTAAVAVVVVASLTGCGAVEPTDPAATGHTTLVTAQPVGTVEGRLLAVGERANIPGSPLAGRLRIKGPDGSLRHAEIGADGRFAIRLSPGAYRLSATSEVFENGKTSCLPDPRVTVLTAGQRVEVDVLCQLR